MNLGRDYVVWDKSACINFKRPGRTALFARFLIDGSELDLIKRELEHAWHVDRTYHVDLTDEQGTVYASIEKVIYIRKKEKSG